MGFKTNGLFCPFEHVARFVYKYEIDFPLSYIFGAPQRVPALDRHGGLSLRSHISIFRLLSRD